VLDRRVRRSARRSSSEKASTAEPATSPESTFVARSEIRRRVAWAAAFVVLIVVAIIAIIEPSDLAWSRAFMWSGSGNAIGSRPAIALGDHLQIAYYLWLWSHALVTGAHFPWVDPYQFALTGHTTLQVTGWPLILVSLPVEAVAGPIAAFNAVVISALVAAAGCAYLLGRALGLPRPAALVTGFAYAFAPFRLIQSGHIGAMLGFLLPLILYFAERAIRGKGNTRAWAWGCAVAYVSLIACGELHLVMYGTALFVTFVVVRSIHAPRERLRALIVPAVVLVAVSAGLMTLIYGFVLSPSGRHHTSLDAVHFYAPRPADLFHRSQPSERYAYPGLVIVVLAVVGFVSALRTSGRKLLSAWLALLIAGAYVLAIAPSAFVTLRWYRMLPFVGFVRVPGRVLVLATLALAIFAGFGATTLVRGRRGWIAVMLVLAALVLDARGATSSFEYTRAGANVLAVVPRGSAVLDLPPFPADHHGASRYVMDVMSNPGPRVGGYDVLAPPEMQDAQRTTMPLTRLPLDGCDWKKAQQHFHFGYVAVHTDLFGSGSLWPTEGPGPVAVDGFGPAPIWPVRPRQLLDAFDRARGFHRVSDIDGTLVYRVVGAELMCPSR
jgi:hypothetical protein